MRIHVASLHEFSQVPIESRVRHYIVEKDQTAIDKIKERILEVRDYYEQLKNSEEIRKKINEHNQ